MSSKSNESTNDTNIPQFPDEKREFSTWVSKMESYLLARGLMQVVLSPSIYITQTTKLDTEKYKEWLDETSKRIKNAEKLISKKKEGEDVSEEEDVKFKMEVEKCTRVSNIIKQSLKQRQLTHIENVFQANAYEMWRIITHTYGLVNTTQSAHLLINLSFSKSETIRQFKITVHEHTTSLPNSRH